MWEPDVVRGYRRKIDSIGKAVTDPDDIVILEALERRLAKAKRDAVRTLYLAGYSYGEIADVTGHSKSVIHHWVNHEKPVECSHEPQTEEFDANDETPDPQS